MEAIFKICKLANFPKLDFYIIFLESSGTYTINLKQKTAVIQNVRVIVIFYWPISYFKYTSMIYKILIFADDTNFFRTFREMVINKCRMTLIN